MIAIHGAHVRRIRILNEQDMGECADATNGKVRRNHWNKIELGYTRRVSPSVFRAIREVLGLTPEEAVYIKGDPWSTTTGDAA